MRNQIMRLQASVPVLRAPVPKQQDAKSPEMTTYESDLLNVLTQRGYVHQVTDAAGLDALAMRQTVPGYIGFDATAPSLHVGSLVQIMMLRHLQKSGGKPIVLMGGGTTKVGDPTDKEKSRPLLTDEQIAANMEGIKKAFQPFLTFGDGPTDAARRAGDQGDPVFETSAAQGINPLPAAIAAEDRRRCYGRSAGSGIRR